MNIDFLDLDLENFRNVFIQSEKEYIKELIKKPYYFHLLKRFYAESPETLFEYAKNMIKSVELGKVHPKDLEDYEAIISILLLCTHDSMRKTIKRAVQKQKESLKAKEQQKREDNSAIEL